MLQRSLCGRRAEPDQLIAESVKNLIQKLWIRRQCSTVNSTTSSKSFVVIPQHTAKGHAKPVIVAR